MIDARAADELIERLLAGGDHEAAHDLLSAFFHGLSLDRLLLLLQSDSEEAAKAGAWIASELGQRAEPLIPRWSTCSTTQRGT